MFKQLLDDVFGAITSFGNPVFYVVVFLVLLNIGMPLAVNIIIALLCVELFCVMVKLLVKKERPQPQSRGGLYNVIDANSFPSVHSARIALLAVMINAYYKDLAVIVFSVVLVLLVGYSRIYLRRHYLKDVIGGFVIGIVIAIIALSI